MPYTVYLPPGYDADPTARYPTVYMLHGMGGSNGEWSGYGLFAAADALIASGRIKPIVIVLPQGDQSYWFDHADGYLWGTHVANEVVPEVDALVRTRADRGSRAIGGLSMGAHGALQLAMNYPNVFGVVGAHAPTVRDWAGMVEYLGEEMAERWYGDETYFERFDPRALLREKPNVARRLKIEIDTPVEGTTWRPVAEEIHELLKDQGVVHEFLLLPGDHNGDRYWRLHAATFLQYYGDAFQSRWTRTARQ